MTDEEEKKEISTVARVHLLAGIALTLISIGGVALQGGSRAMFYLGVLALAFSYAVRKIVEAHGWMLPVHWLDVMQLYHVVALFLLWFYSILFAATPAWNPATVTYAFFGTHSILSKAREMGSPRGLRSWWAEIIMLWILFSMVPWAAFSGSTVGTYGGAVGGVTSSVNDAVWGCASDVDQCKELFLEVPRRVHAGLTLLPFYDSLATIGSTGAEYAGESQYVTMVRCWFAVGGPSGIYESGTQTELAECVTAGGTDCSTVTCGDASTSECTEDEQYASCCELGGGGTSVSCVATGD